MVDDTLAMEHPNVDPDEDLGLTAEGKSPSLADRLRSTAAQFLPPLPENAWGPGKTPPPADQLDADATTTSDRSDAGSLFDPSETAAFTGSTKGLAEFRRGTAKLYGGLAGALAAMVAGFANWRVKEADDDQIWLMTEEEAAGIGEPLGRIAARRATLPIGDGDETNDVLDGMQVAIAAVSYLGRNMMARADRKRPQRAPMPGHEAAA